MGQSEVMEFLHAHKKKTFTTKEMAAAMGVSVGTVCTTMRRLRHHRLVKFKELMQHGRKYHIYWL